MIFDIDLLVLGLENVLKEIVFMAKVSFDVENSLIFDGFFPKI